MPTPKRIRKQSDTAKPRPKSVAARAQFTEDNDSSTQRDVTMVSKAKQSRQSQIPTVINLRERAKQRFDEQAREMESSDTESEDEGKDPVFQSDREEPRNDTYDDLRNNGAVSNRIFHIILISSIQMYSSKSRSTTRKQHSE